MHLIATLKKYGLQEDEAKIYISLLKLVEAPVYQIAADCNVPRTSAYRLLQNLKNKELALSFKKKNTQYFTAESPQILLDRLWQKENLIKKILPQLQNLSAETKDPGSETSLFIGKEGIKRVYNGMLNDLRQRKTKQLFAISQPQLFNLMPNFFPKWVGKRQKLGIFSYIIMPDNADSREIAEKYSDKTKQEIRFLPQKYHWAGTLNIYCDKIALFSLDQKELSAVIIKNKTLADMMKNFFQFNWEVLAEKQSAPKG